MLVIFLRTLLIYFLIILAMRLMGKKQLGELQPSELVSTILISNLASIPIESPEIPPASSILPVFVIVCLEILLSALCMLWRPAAKIISGAPRIVINQGKIDQQALRSLRFTADDLLEALRGKDVFSLEDVALGIVETNGTLSVYKTFAADNVRNADANTAPPANTLPPMPLIVDGKCEKDNLQLLQLKPNFIEQCCNHKHCTPQQVLLLLCDDAENVTLIRKEKASKSKEKL